MAAITGKIPGKGTIFSVETATPGTYVVVGNVTTIAGPNIEVSEKDDTVLTDTVKKTSPGLNDGGDITVSLFYTPAEAGIARLIALLNETDPDKKIVSVKLTLNDNIVSGSKTSVTASGWVKSIHLNGMEQDGNVGAEVGIRLTTIATLS